MCIRDDCVHRRFLGEGDRGRPSKVIHHFLSLPRVWSLESPQSLRILERIFVAHATRGWKKKKLIKAVHYIACPDVLVLLIRIFCNSIATVHGLELDETNLLQIATRPRKKKLHWLKRRYTWHSSFARCFHSRASLTNSKLISSMTFRYRRHLLPLQLCWVFIFFLCVQQPTNPLSTRSRG